MAGYVCSKKPLTDPKAIEAYAKALKETAIYRNAKDFMTVSYLLCKCPIITCRHMPTHHLRQYTDKAIVVCKIHSFSVVSPTG